VPTADEYRLLGFTDADRDEAERSRPDEAAVAATAEKLRGLIGTFPDERAARDVLPDDQRVALAAFLRTLPDIRRYHAGLGVPDEISWASLADIGRQVWLHRRTHGEFGFETRWWLIPHWSGVLYQLGRLQFLLYAEHEPVPGVEPGEWVVGVHIPETGPLTPEAVDDSLAQAATFFAEHFGDKPVRTATLHSWLLDPYLVEHLPAGSNMVRFARRFTLLDRPLTNDDGSAVYFTFRTRDLDRLDRLPRDTSLQRLVLDRIATGDHWHNVSGYLALRTSPAS
jgi:GNAT-like C-terminal domain/N-acyltransferase N-terminal domain